MHACTPHQCIGGIPVIDTAAHKHTLCQRLKHRRELYTCICTHTLLGWLYFTLGVTSHPPEQHTLPSHISAEIVKQGGDIRYGEKMLSSGLLDLGECHLYYRPSLHSRSQQPSHLQCQVRRQIFGCAFMLVCANSLFGGKIQFSFRIV